MKIVLAVVGGMLLVGCLAMVALGALGARFFRQAADPTQARSVAHEITEYELPAGYRELMGFNMMGAKMVMISSGDLAASTGGGMPDSLLIMLMQAPGAADEAVTMREQMLARMGGQYGMGGSKLQPVGTLDSVIRGQDVVLDVSEGVSGDGTEIRMLSGVFEGKGGQALLAVVAPVAAWDEAALNAFLASMH